MKGKTARSVFVNHNTNHQNGEKSHGGWGDCDIPKKYLWQTHWSEGIGLNESDEALVIPIIIDHVNLMIFLCEAFFTEEISVKMAFRTKAISAVFCLCEGMFLLNFSMSIVHIFDFVARISLKKWPFFGSWGNYYKINKIYMAGGWKIYGGSVRKNPYGAFWKGLCQIFEAWGCCS